MENEDLKNLRRYFDTPTDQLLDLLDQMAPRIGTPPERDFISLLSFVHRECRRLRNTPLRRMNATQTERLFMHSRALLNANAPGESGRDYTLFLFEYMLGRGMEGLDLQRVYANLADVSPELLVQLGRRLRLNPLRWRAYRYLLRDAARSTDSPQLWTALRDLGHRPHNAVERRAMAPLGVATRFPEDPVEGGVDPGFAFSAAVQEGDFEEARAIARANPNISTRHLADEAEGALRQMHGRLRRPLGQHDLYWPTYRGGADPLGRRGRYEATGRMLRARGLPAVDLVRKFDYDVDTDNTVSSRRTLARTAVASRIAADSNARVLPPNASEEQKVINLLARLPEEIRRRIISYLVDPQDVMVLADPTRFYPRLQHTPEDLFQPGRNVREFCYHLQGEDQYEVRLLHMVMFPHLVVPADMRVVCDNIARALRF